MKDEDYFDIGAGEHGVRPARTNATSCSRNLLGVRLPGFRHRGLLLTTRVRCPRKRVRPGTGFALAVINQPGPERSPDSLRSPGASMAAPSYLINAPRTDITHSRWARCFRPVRLLRTTIRTQRRKMRQTPRMVYPASGGLVSFSGTAFQGFGDRQGRGPGRSGTYGTPGGCLVVFPWAGSRRVREAQAGNGQGRRSEGIA